MYGDSQIQKYVDGLKNQIKKVKSKKYSKKKAIALLKSIGITNESSKNNQSTDIS